MSDGDVISNFTGNLLVKSEPDASSFPNGGLRETHMARGYTVWDPCSHPFVMDTGKAATLYIPSVFFSWEGATLDQKLPFLRATETLERETLRLFRILGDNSHNYVFTDSGPEQEFFLIDRKYYDKRPDLKICGRTLFGTAPPKGQELEDQYLGDLSVKALNCLNEVEEEAWKVGIPMITRHREVAPGQYELACVFDKAPVSGDQNLVLMEVLKKVAQKHNMKALFHEKPFARVNGSGKHNNWSLGTDKVRSIFHPGDHPEENMQFMLFLAGAIRAVDLHADLLRLCVTGASNDHRLGANEAPPAIMSMFIGQDLQYALEKYVTGNSNPSELKLNLDLGVKSLPMIKRDTADRNRTSPFAYTGNKFEFRAVGSSQPPARSNLMLTTMMADSMKYLGDEVQKRLGKMSVPEAIHDVVKDIYNKHKRVIFNGNNYSAEWRNEAIKRGLPNYETTPDALPQFTSNKNIELFKSLNVMSKKELESRQSILADEYVKKQLMEAKCASYLTRKYVLPTAYKTNSFYKTGVSFGDNCGNFYKTYGQIVNNIEGKELKLEKIIEDYSLHKKDDPLKLGKRLLGDIVPCMAELRADVDTLETMIDARDWPLASYYEMLFMQS